MYIFGKVRIYAARQVLSLPVGSVASLLNVRAAIGRPILLHGAVGKACHKIVHFSFASHIVGLVQDVLFLLFGQVRIAGHGGSVLRQCHTESNGNFVEIHSHTSLCCGIQHIFDEDAVTRRRIIHQHMGHGADQFSVLYNRRAGHADVK